MPHPRKTGDFTTTVQILKLSAAALVIGVVCAFIAIALLKMIYFFTNLFFYQHLSLHYITPTHNHLHAWVILPPIIGALIIGLIARYGAEQIRGHGIPEAMEAMIVNGSKVKPNLAFWKPISAAISIGSGGPFGAEGPIIMTGGSFGSLFSQFFNLSAMERRVLLVAGAAGGMSATFAAPVSSVLFAVELLVFEFKPRSLVPIALASAAADAVRTIFLGPGPLFPMPQLTHVSGTLLGAGAAIGLAGAVFAILLTYIIYGIEDAFRKLPMHWMWWPALGAIVIGVGGWIAPRALGVGYGSISAMLNVTLAWQALLALLLVKIVIWAVGLGSGTSGGILAPILIIGGSFGGLAGELLHVSHPGVWALLGMSAIFSGITRTPFTSVIFPLELTHNLGALLPLLVASSVATGLSSLVLPRSILTEKIARRGLHLTREYHTDPLQMNYCRDIAWLPTLTVKDASTVQEISNVLMHNRSETFVTVVDTNQNILNILPALTIIRESNRIPHCAIAQILPSVPAVRDTDTAKTALQQMIRTSTAWVCVVDPNDRVLGFVGPDQLLHLRQKEYEEEFTKTKVFAFFPRTRSKKPVPKPQKQSY